MQIDKKIKCLHCGEEINFNKVFKETKSCKCGKVQIYGIVIMEGVEGKDYKDISPVLLNE